MVSIRLRWKKHEVEIRGIVEVGYNGSYFEREKLKGLMLLPPQPDIDSPGTSRSVFAHTLFLLDWQGYRSLCVKIYRWYVSFVVFRNAYILPHIFSCILAKIHVKAPSMKRGNILLIFMEKFWAVRLIEPYFVSFLSI